MNSNWLSCLACVHLLFLFFTSYFSISVKLYNYINSFTLINHCLIVFKSLWRALLWAIIPDSLQVLKLWGWIWPPFGIRLLLHGWNGYVMSWIWFQQSDQMHVIYRRWLHAVDISCHQLMCTITVYVLSGLKNLSLWLFDFVAHVLPCQLVRLRKTWQPFFSFCLFVF